MEHGETFEQALRREVKEEYCADIKNFQYIDTQNVLRQVGDKTTHWVAILFLVEVDPAEVSIGDPEKMEDIGWFAFDELPAPLHSKFPEHFTIARSRFLNNKVYASSS